MTETPTETPPPTSTSPLTPFARFVEIVRSLRDPVSGCPWDLKQNHQSLRPYLIEETYEVLEAIDRGNDQEFCEELGDVLLQVVLHAQLANERKAFSIDDVAQAISEKMIRRHPHVFGQTTVKDEKEVLVNWEQLKLTERKEKEQKGKDDTKGQEEKLASALDGVPGQLPALLRAQRLGEKASRVGFDWEAINGVWSKVQEEMRELEQELTNTSNDKARLEHELGDLLFALCQLARWMDLDAEGCLQGASKRFLGRFRAMEQQLPEPLNKVTPEDWDKAWNKAKLQSEPSL